MLKQGLSNMSEEKPPIGLCFILSYPIGLLEIGSIYFAALAIHQPIQYIFAVIAGISEFIAQSLPLTLAGFGIHETTITGKLLIFGVVAQTGLSIALVDHAACAIVIFVFGIPSTIHIAFASRWYFRKNRNNEFSKKDPRDSND
jgi:uncharacterized membrane protein YbhN (UPF0104 family)